jgi:hypothetical protein
LGASTSPVSHSQRITRRIQAPKSFVLLLVIFTPIYV